MESFEKKSFEIFELFKKNWALVSAGSLDHYNCSTVSWGSLGTLWTRPGKNGSIVTLYLYPPALPENFWKKMNTLQ